jgi:hypothetical protein
MSQLIKQEQIDCGNDDNIGSIEGSECTLETISIGTIGEGDTHENGSNSINAPLLEVALSIDHNMGNPV